MSVPQLGSRPGDWTEKELRLLRRQLKEGKKLREINIPGRTIPAIDNQMRRWKLRSKSRWTRKEKSLLKQQVAEGVVFEKLAIPGRSAHAIAGMYAKLVGVRRRPWTKEEDRELLKQLAAGSDVSSISMPKRTASAVKRRLYDSSTFHWTAEQDQAVRDQMAAGAIVTELAVPGRTKLAASRRAIELGLYKPKSPINRKPWTTKHVGWLRRMALEQRMTPEQISLSNIFPGRSVLSLSAKIRELRHQDEARRLASVQAGSDTVQLPASL